MLIDTAILFRILDDQIGHKRRGMRQGLQQNDLAKSQIALGGELCCEELERTIKLHLQNIDATRDFVKDLEQRREQEREQKNQERKSSRQILRETAKREAAR